MLRWLRRIGRRTHSQKLTVNVLFSVFYIYFDFRL